LSAPEKAEVIGAFHEYEVLLFRGQRLTEKEHVAFTHVFGEPEIHPLDQYLAGENPEILVVDNGVDGTGQTVGLDEADVIEWHSDLFWHKTPSIGSLLRGVTIPPVGGDTLFASLRHAWATLDPAIQERVEHLQARRSLDFLTENERKLNPLKPSLTDEQRRKAPPVVHPIVRTHPASKRKSLFIGDMVIEEVLGVSIAEGQQLIKDLLAHSTKPDVIYRHRWQQDDLVVFDNRCVIHTVTPTSREYRRTLHRTTLKGEPVQ
jgi:taurine dioxygenase